MAHQLGTEAKGVDAAVREIDADGVRWRFGRVGRRQSRWTSRRLGDGSPAGRHGRISGSRPRQLLAVTDRVGCLVIDVGAGPDFDRDQAASAAIGPHDVEVVVDDRPSAIHGEDLDLVGHTCGTAREIIDEVHGGVRSRTDDECLRAAVRDVGRGPCPFEHRARNLEEAGGEGRPHDRDDQGDRDEGVARCGRGEWPGPPGEPGQPCDPSTTLWRDGDALDDRSKLAVGRALVRRREQMLPELDGKSVVHHAIRSPTRNGSRSSASIAARSALVARYSRDLVVPIGIPIACAASASGRSR